MNDKLKYGVLTVSLVAGLNTQAEGGDRPNFVLIASEDNSIHFMNHFYPGGAKTPNIEDLAQEGVTFSRAFSNAPVCSASRTALITANYGPRIATHNHRQIEMSELPDDWEMFPYYLRQEGYYTVIQGKKDFNAVEGDIWDDDGNQAHWSSRPDDDTPFLFMKTIHVTHEGQLHFDEKTYRNQPTTHDPSDVELFPYLPDTDLMRYTHAFYLDRHIDMDDQVGEVLAGLEAEGLYENTIIIYYGDHGGTLPRSKGYLYEGGLHVPLVVYIPEKFHHLSPFGPGSRVDGFVEFVDFGPTILNLAGVSLPPHMDGKPFLGQDITGSQVYERDETLSYVDRLDEKYDMVRALRKGDYKYIRNYWPYYPDALMNAYRYRQLAFTQWRDIYEAGGLNEVQSRFFEPRQPEALYDLANDPHETRNLAGNPEFEDVLVDMRGRLRQRLRKMPDLGLFPESYLLEHAMNDPEAFGKRNITRITKLLDVADLMLLPFDEARSYLEAALQSDDSLMRYWALIVCSVFGEKASDMVKYVDRLTSDENLAVRVRAAEFLALIAASDPMSILYDAANKAEQRTDALLALNTMAYLRDYLDYEIDYDRIELKDGISGVPVDSRMEYLQTPTTN